jgi:hypothetical protein
MKKKFVMAFLFACTMAMVTPATCVWAEEATEAPAEEQENNYYEVLNADEVNIQDTGLYTIRLKAKTGWQFDIPDNTDVTSWIVDADNQPLFGNATGIALAVNAEDFELDVTIDASKIEGFSTNGADTIYVRPSGANPMVVEGDNKGMYNASTLKAGTYTLPSVEVIGTIEGESASGEYSLTETSVVIALQLDNIDDSLIDSSNASVSLLQGDGYILEDYPFENTPLTGEWTDGKLTFTVDPEQLTGNYSPMGGDGNGNYYINLGISGLSYNGLPLADTSFRAHIYAYGRTFTIEGIGSLISDTQPEWSTDSENGIPVLCDSYPDFLNITWPVNFDASSLTTEDFTITLKGDYGDKLVLTPGTDYFLETTEAGRTVIDVNYIYWAYTPVYKTMTVDVNTDNLVWDETMYEVKNISHDYDIASVYAYSVMSGGMEGTQAWTYYGLDGFENWEQCFKIPTYTLTMTSEDGSTIYYTEDEAGNGAFTDMADEAMKFDSREDNNCRVIDNTAYFDRVYDQTQDVEVNGQTYTLDKVYSNADNMTLQPDECTGVTAERGYIIGNGWMMHSRWPWQNFLNEGYQGGTN